MLKFFIEGNSPAKNMPFKLEALHSDNLENRKGYNSRFLGTIVPLPLVADSLKDDIAVLQKEIGKNGDHVLDYTHFSVVLSKSMKMPYYTAVNIDGVTNLMNMVHDARGSDAWFADPRIIQGTNKFQYSNKEYEGSGFQKGHMVRYFDPAWGSTALEKKQAMGDTFHFSNCCPQLPYYNSVVWNYLEDYYLARAIFQDKKITVFTGPVFNKAQRINGLLVPVNFWKVVVYKTKTGISAMGLIMSQEKYFDRLKAKSMLPDGMIPAQALTKDSIDKLYSKKELIDAKVKISLIEEKTNIRFGLNEVDEKKDHAKLDIEVINPSSHLPLNAQASIKEMPDKRQQKKLQDFFEAI
ncbi:MAG: DNA/RNA non-specific endonuclease [Chitinophagaceae bacterium]